MVPIIAVPCLRCSATVDRAQRLDASFCSDIHEANFRRILRITPAAPFACVTGLLEGYGKRGHTALHQVAGIRVVRAAQPDGTWEFEESALGWIDTRNPLFVSTGTGWHYADGYDVADESLRHSPDLISIMFQRVSLPGSPVRLDWQREPYEWHEWRWHITLPAAADPFTSPPPFGEMEEDIADAIAQLRREAFPGAITKKVGRPLGSKSQTKAAQEAVEAAEVYRLVQEDWTWPAIARQLGKSVATAQRRLQMYEASHNRSSE